MSFLGKKRTNSTFLKYKNGKIITLGEDEKINSNNIGESNIEENIDAEPLSQFNNKNNQEYTNNNSPKRKKSKVLLIIGSCIIIIPLVILGFKSFNGSIKNVSNYMDSTNTEISNNTSNNKEEEQNDMVSNDTEINKSEIFQDVDINIMNNSDSSIDLGSILSKFTPEKVVLYSNKVNSNLTKYYSLMKSDILLFYDAKDSSYTTSKNLSTIRIIVNKDYESIIKQKSIFEKENQNELYITIKNRYLNLLNTIDSIVSDTSRTTCASKFNTGLAVDNELYNQQQEFMNNFFKK